MNSRHRDTSPLNQAAAGLLSELDAPTQRRVVWTLKEPGGRVVTGPDVHVRALARRADMLHRLGLGGGIVSLLLPATVKARKRLELDRTKYHLRRVKPRNTGERGKARELHVISWFLYHAIALKEHANSKMPIDAFLKWLIAELADGASPVSRLALANEEFNVFLNEPRRLGWWQKRVTELRKMSR